MLSSYTAVPDRRGRRSKGPRVNPPGLNLTSSLSQSVTRSLMAKAGKAHIAKAVINANVASESAGKPDALQTLRDESRQGEKFRASVWSASGLPALSRCHGDAPSVRAPRI